MDARQWLLEELVGDTWLEEASAAILRACRARKARLLSRMRRGGWHPKPRQWRIYAINEEELVSAAARWEHDSSKASLWRDLALADLGAWGRNEFRRTFGVPPSIFASVYEAIKEVPGFADKTDGDGCRGRRSKPLKLKLAAFFVVVREGITFKRAGKLACMDSNAIRRFYHKLTKWLVQHEYCKHVYMPTTDRPSRSVKWGAKWVPMKKCM